ncbi:MAG: sulfatase-like hydrolase/transferase [Planctomycetota bacterium]
MAARRPNILWVSFEDTLPLYPCYGDPTAKLPNLDRLAASGCIYPNAFSTAPVCAPARSGVITGMYPVSIGTHHMRTSHCHPATPELPTPYEAVIPHYAKCFPEYLRAAGYYCTNNEKTDYQFNPPLTAWDDCSSTAHWRNRPDPDQPFFAVWNPTRTHESGMWEEKGFEITVDPDTMPLPPYLPDTPKVRTALARMYSNIEYNDRILGELLDQLEEDGLADNTIVMHWSDHGPMPRGKRWPYDSGIHSPLIIRWPGTLEAGSKNDRLVSTVDLGPTVLSLCGAPVPHHMQGRAFLGGQEAPEREYIYASRDRYDESYDMVRAVRDKRYKYIRHCRPDLPYLLWIPYRNRHPILEEMWRLHRAGELEGPAARFFQPRPIEELYDTEADPHELENLAADPAHAETKARLAAALDAWRNEVGDLGEVPEAEMVFRWYGGAEQPVTAAPIAIPFDDEHTGVLPAEGVVDLAAPALVQLHSATQGVSIAWTFEAGAAPHWQLYTEPIRLEPGTHHLRTRAIRIGFKESAEHCVTFRVK